MTRAKVYLWAKGFRVSHHHEEFQLVFPPRPPRKGLASSLVEIDWGETLDELGALSSGQLEREFAVSFDEDSILVLRASASRDRVGRDAVVIVGLELPRVDGDGCSASIAGALQLSGRLAAAYGGVLGESRQQHTERQLQQGQFLESPEIAIKHAGMYDVEPRMSGIESVLSDWSPVYGVTTPAFARLGGNILIGTRVEAESLSARGIAAVLDSRGVVDALTGSNLTRSESREERSPPLESPAQLPNSETQRIDTRVDEGRPRPDEVSLPWWEPLANEVVGLARDFVGAFVEYLGGDDDKAGTSSPSPPDQKKLKKKKRKD